MLATSRVAARFLSLGPAKLARCNLICVPKQSCYLEITYAQKDEAKPFGVRWDPKEKLWYFPGDVLPKELERFRPANAPKGPVEKIVLDIPFRIVIPPQELASGGTPRLKPVSSKNGLDRRYPSNLKGSNRSSSVGKRSSRGS
jgi:Domain of unknown function (DUF5710)